MKTTIDIRDDLLTAAKVAAAKRKTSLKQIIEHALERELSDLEEKRQIAAENGFMVDEHGLPYFPSQGRTITNEDVYRLLNED